MGGMGPGMMGTGPHGMMWGGPWTEPPAGASSDGTLPPGVEEIPPGTIVIELRQMRFEPRQATIAAGTTVLFVNRDSYPHRIVQSSLTDLGQKPAGFTSPVLSQGQRWSYTFSATGTLPILCDVAGHHLAGMVGQIVVR